MSCLMYYITTYTSRDLTVTATKQTGGEHKETGQLELSSKLKYTVYSLFI